MFLIARWRACINASWDRVPTELQHGTLYFKLESLNNVTYTTTTRTQIAKELLFQ